MTYDRWAGLYWKKPLEGKLSMRFIMVKSKIKGFKSR